MDPKEELKRFKPEYGLLQKKFCPTEEQTLYRQLKNENRLPDDIIEETSGFFHLIEGDLLPEDAIMLCLSRQTKIITSIRLSLAILGVIIALTLFMKTFHIY